MSEDHPDIHTTYDASVPLSEELIDDSEKKYVGYCVRVNTSNQESWQLTKRYSEFLTIHTYLKGQKGFPQVAKFDFPKKEFGWLAFNKDIIEKRRDALDHYVKLLTELDPMPAEVQTFLGIIDSDPAHELTRMDSNMSAPSTPMKNMKKMDSLIESEGDDVDEEVAEKDAVEEMPPQTTEEMPPPSVEDSTQKKTSELFEKQAPEQDTKLAPPPTDSSAAKPISGVAQKMPTVENIKSEIKSEIESIKPGAVRGIWPAVFLACVFAMLLIMADYLDGTETPRVFLLTCVLSLTAFLIALQPHSELSAGNFISLPILANALLVFGIIYIALVMGYLTSATAVLTAACLLTFLLAAVEDIIS